MLCLDHGRVTDKFENAVIDRHVYPGMREWPHTTEWVRSGGGFYQGASVAGTRWQHQSPWATAQVQVRQVWRLRTAMTDRSEEHTSELQSLMRISYAVFCSKKKNINHKNNEKYD